MKIVAFILYSTFLTLGAYSVGLVSESKNWYYDLTYNPMTGVMITMFQTSAIFYISQRKK